MNKKIYVLLVCMIVVLVASAYLENREYVLLEFYYDNGEISLINKSLEKGNFPTLNHDIGKDYTINLVADGLILYSSDFDPTLLYSDSFEEEMQGGVEELDEAVFFIMVPSIKEGKSVEILKDNKKILEEEIYNVGASSCRIK